MMLRVDGLLSADGLIVGGEGWGEGALLAFARYGVKSKSTPSP